MFRRTVTVLILIVVLFQPIAGIAENDAEKCVRLRDAGRYCEAVLAGEAAAGMEKGNLSAWFCLGDSWARMGGHLPQAISALSNALVTAQRDYDRMKVYYRIGEVLEGVSGEEKALLEAWTQCARLAAATEDRKTLMTAKKMRARYLDETGNRIGAIAEYAELVQLMGTDSRRAIVLNNKAALHLKLGQLNEAEKDLKTAVAVDEAAKDTENRLWHRASLGYVYAQQGRMGEAMKTLIDAHNEAVKHGKMDDRFWYTIHTYMSEAYIKGGYFQQGKEHAALAEKYYAKAYSEYAATGAGAKKKSGSTATVEKKGDEYGKGHKAASGKSKRKSGKRQGR